MISVLNIPVILMYLNFGVATIGIINTFNGRTKLSVICLIICGLISIIQKHLKTKEEKSINVYTELVAFCILPIVIGMRLMMADIVYIPVYVIFALASFVNLDHTLSSAKINHGLSIKATSIIIPFLYVFRGMKGFIYLYPTVLLILALLYVTKVKHKINIKNGVYILIGIELLELIFVIAK